VEITIADRGAERGHDGHEDDIVPAPEGGCPSSDPARSVAGAPAAGDPAVPGAASSGSPVTPSGAPAGTEGAPTGILTSSRMGEERDRIEVLGEVDTEAPAGEPAAAAPTAATEAPDGGLPFTGLDLIAVIAAGIAALLTGLALWRATRPRPTV
jgi:hypothetical protein